MKTRLTCSLVLLRHPVLNAGTEYSRNNLLLNDYYSPVNSEPIFIVLDIRYLKAQGKDGCLWLNPEQSERFPDCLGSSESIVGGKVRAGLLYNLMFILIAGPASGASIAPNLGTASSFGLLGDTISNTGTSLVNGNVGARTTITGFPPGTSTGTVYTAPSDPTVVAAYNDFILAYTQAFSDISTPPTQSLADLTVNRTFIGNNVYTFPVTDVISTANINLTFDAQGNGNEVFIIKTARDLTINGPLTFTLSNGALSSNIYWIVGRTATISSGGGPVTFDGDILAGTSFTMSANPGGSGVLAGTINGCVFAETANTLAGKTQVNGCSPNSPNSVPEPGSMGLMAIGCLLGALGMRKLSMRKLRAVPQTS